MSDFENAPTFTDTSDSPDDAPEVTDEDGGEIEPAPGVAPNGPGGGVLLSSLPEAEIEKSDLEKRAEEVAEANAHSKVTKGGYTPTKTIE